MPTPKILAFGGALRRGSFNQKLATIAAQGAREAGAEVTLIALRDYPLPVFDGDLEDAEGMPENGKKLKALFRGHDGWIISTPEYNSSIPGALKNVIDWVSREETDDEPPAFRLYWKDGDPLLCVPRRLGRHAQSGDGALHPHQHRSHHAARQSVREQGP